jgi:hypothetical protein
MDSTNDMRKVVNHSSDLDCPHSILYKIRKNEDTAHTVNNIYDDQEDFSETEYVDTKMHDNRNLRKRQTNKGEIVYHEYAKFGPWMRKLTWMILLTVCAVLRVPDEGYFRNTLCTLN